MSSDQNDVNDDNKYNDSKEPVPATPIQTFEQIKRKWEASLKISDEPEQLKIATKTVSELFNWVDCFGERAIKENEQFKQTKDKLEMKIKSMQYTVATLKNEIKTKSEHISNSETVKNQQVQNMNDSFNRKYNLCQKEIKQLKDKLKQSNADNKTLINKNTSYKSNQDLVMRAKEQRIISLTTIKANTDEIKSQLNDMCNYCMRPNTNDDESIASIQSIASNNNESIERLKTEIDNEINQAKQKESLWNEEKEEDEYKCELKQIEQFINKHKQQIKNENENENKLFLFELFEPEINKLSFKIDNLLLLLNGGKKELSSQHRTIIGLDTSIKSYIAKSDESKQKQFLLNENNDKKYNSVFSKIVSNQKNLKQFDTNNQTRVNKLFSNLQQELSRFRTLLGLDVSQNMRCNNNQMNHAIKSYIKKVDEANANKIKKINAHLSQQLAKLQPQRQFIASISNQFENKVKNQLNSHMQCIKTELKEHRSSIKASGCIIFNVFIANLLCAMIYVLGYFVYLHYMNNFCLSTLYE